MAEQGLIRPESAEEAAARPLGVKPSRFYREKRESYFFDYVTDELVEGYGVKDVRSGGLRINTTIDLDLQDKARDAIAKSLSFAGAPSSAIVTIDPSNGYIRAMASSAKYADSKFNLAAQGKRQPGSTFKIMALIAALRRGVDPNSTTYPSKPLKFTAPGYGPIDVNSYGGRCAGGSKNLVRATLSSDNSVYTQLALDLGPEAVVKAARGHGHPVQARGLPGGGARRPHALLLAAGDGQRLRDDRSGRLAQQAHGDHQGRASPTARSTTWPSRAATRPSTPRRCTR